MAITRNFTAIILLLAIAFALAIGITIARANGGHSGVATTTSVGAPSLISKVPYDF
jgi:hypothetical protein